MKDNDAASSDGSRPPARKPASDDLRPDLPARALPGEPVADPADGADRVDLSGLSIVGITRRRVSWVAAGLLAVWIVVVFARQVGDATTAANRASQMAIDNAALAVEVAALKDEVALIVEPRFVRQQARGHGLGTEREVPFTLDPTIAAPVDGAPGSAAVRLGAGHERQTPLESWLSLLFGPGD